MHMQVESIQPNAMLQKNHTFLKSGLQLDPVAIIVIFLEAIAS